MIDQKTTSHQLQVRPDLPEEQEHEVSLGTEVHGAVYVIAGAAYLWMLLIAWITFSSPTGADLDLGFVTVIFAVFMGLAVLAYSVAHSHLHKRLPAWDEFVSSRISIATGAVQGWEMGVQIMIIPIALALAATALGIVYALT